MRRVALSCRNDFTSRELEKMLFFLTCFFSLFDHIVRNRRIADMHIDTIVASVLFKTQLLHDASFRPKLAGFRL